MFCGFVCCVVGMVIYHTDLCVESGCILPPLTLPPLFLLLFFYLLFFFLSGWVTGESLLRRFVPLWVSARKAEFLWSNVFLACQANVNLVSLGGREGEGGRERGRGR